MAFAAAATERGFAAEVEGKFHFVADVVVVVVGGAVDEVVGFEGWDLMREKLRENWKGSQMSSDEKT